MKFIKTTLVCALFIVTLGANSQTVYVSSNGKKFHKKNCDLVKTGKKGVALNDAKLKGFEACKHCKPEDYLELKKEKVPAKNK